MLLGQYKAVLGQYLVVLCQNRAILAASVICFQKIYGLHGLKHQIIEYSKKEKLMTDKQTEFPLVDSTTSVEGVEQKDRFATRTFHCIGPLL